jgi:fucose permease
MCLLMAFTGFCSGQLDVCANVLMIKEFDSAAQSEAYIMALHASFAVGAAVSPVFVTELMLRSSDKISFNIPFFCIAGLFLPAVLVGAFYIARLPVRSQTEASSESYSNQSISNVKRWVLVGLFSLVMCLYVGSEVAFGLYIFTYATEKPDPWEKGALEMDVTCSQC